MTGRVGGEWWECRKVKQSLHLNNKARLRAPEPSFAGPMRFTWVRGMEEEEGRMDFIHVDGCFFFISLRVTDREGSGALRAECINGTNKLL